MGEIQLFIANCGRGYTEGQCKRRLPAANPGMAKRIQEARLRLNWSQTTLAKKARVGPSLIYYLEKGRNAGQKSLAKIARALGVTEEYLRGEACAAA